MGSGSLPSATQASAHLLRIMRAGLPVNERLTTVSASPPSVIASFWNRSIPRSEEHTSELQSLMRISYAGFCLKKKNKTLTTRDYAGTQHTASGRRRNNYNDKSQTHK